MTDILALENMLHDAGFRGELPEMIDNLLKSDRNYEKQALELHYSLNEAGLEGSLQVMVDGLIVERASYRAQVQALQGQLTRWTNPTPPPTPPSDPSNPMALDFYEGEVRMISEVMERTLLLLNSSPGKLGVSIEGTTFDIGFWRMTASKIDLEWCLSRLDHACDVAYAEYGS